MQKHLSVLVCFGSMAVAASVGAANIAWVSFSPGDNTPSVNAANAGFTRAPDAGYTDLLQANGYTVTRFVTADEFNVNQLLGYDLVIIGRGVNSGHYQSATESAAWNGLPVKLVDMSGYTLRASRLGWTTGETIPDTAGTITLHANGLSPIFAGVPMDGASGNMFNPFANIVTYTAFGTNVVTTRGISVNTNPFEGNPQVLATVGTAGDPALGGAIISIWGPNPSDPTAPVAGVTKINGGTDVMGGWRMAFMSGSREASGVSSETAGIYDLTPDGAKVFLNSINYFLTVVPEPSSLALFAFGSLALLLRRKKA